MDCILRRGRPLLLSAGLPNLVSTYTRRQFKIYLPVHHRLSRYSTPASMSSPQSTAAMPPMMYGTAWKKDRTADLVYQAIKAGFRGIDTAAMKKHYDEAGTGEGIRRAIREGIVSRKDLFIQTKFTPLDPTSPYPISDPIPAQIHASITSSLTNLSTPSSSSSSSSSSPEAQEPYLDAIILHSPYPSIPQTLEAWSALQSYLPTSPDPSRRGKILRLGISNVTLPILHALSSYPGLKPPVIVQNRFRAAERSWDRDVRQWCAQQQKEGREVNYQGFWTLTGNVATWTQDGGFVAELAEKASVSRAAAWYALIMEAGVVVLNGTGDRGHMREDLDVRQKMEEWRGTGEGREVWGRCWEKFKGLVDG